MRQKILALSIVIACVGCTADDIKQEDKNRLIKADK